MRFEKDVKYAVLAILIYAAEAAFGKYIAVAGAVPMLTFSFLIVCSAKESDLSYVMVLAVILGAVTDIMHGHGFGTYTIAFAFSAFYTFKLKNAIFSSGWLFLVIDAFLLTFLVQFFYMITHIGDIGSGNFLRCLWSLVLPQAVYNTLICCLFYFISGKISRKRR
ncbi:MAG: rod shape-determining protein MreD [Clostridia bacterium]|nr:rod shape-determining protein MreD [Clostridia bacterium]